VYRRIFGVVVVLFLLLVASLYAVRSVSPSTVVSTSTSGFAIRPIPPSETSGTGSAKFNSSGDLALDVSVVGPAAEISRTGPGGQSSNLIWHLLTGTCAEWSAARGASGPGRDVLARWGFPPQRPDALDFHYVVPRTDLKGYSRTTPYAVAAFRNGGGGPLYSCGDLPVL